MKTEKSEVKKNAVETASSSQVAVKEAPKDLVVENSADIGDKITLPDSLIPVALTKAQLPKQEYWAGTCKNPCFHATRIAGWEFPEYSFDNPPGRGPSNHKLGTKLMLTEDEVKLILLKSVQVGWRHNIVEKRDKKGKKVVVGDTWKPVHYDAGEPALAGDKLTAHFVYLRKLKPGQKIPIGLFDSEGDPLPRPAPLKE
jgi:hypothetical protein